MLKYTTRLITTTFAVMTLMSCSKMLDTKPEDSLQPGQFYQTETQLKMALSGIYSSLTDDGTYSRNIPIEL